MATNPKWPRWVFASVHKHLHTLLDAHLALVVTTVDEITKTYTESPNKAEVTLSGPHFNEVSSNDHQATLGIFVTLTSHAGSHINGLNHVELVGKIQNALDRCIEVREYEQNGSGEYVATLEVNPNEDDQIRATNLKPAATEKLAYTVIEARYVGNF